MTGVDQRVIDGLREQLASWRAELQGGARRIGWKIGLNIPEAQAAFGIDEPVIGYLTSATLVDPRGSYAAEGAVALRAEPEVALEVGRDVSPAAGEDGLRDAIAGYAPAIELVDVGDAPRGDLQAIVATNVFHRAVALGDSRPALPGKGAAVLRIGGEERESADVPEDFAEVIGVTARLLDAAGERLRAGDRIIAGSLTPQVPVAPGDDVTLELGSIGSVGVRVT